MQNRPPHQYQQGQPPYNPYAAWQAQAAFTKSFTTPAIICLILYIFLWVPGLIANIIYLVEANRAKALTGTNPDGYGCLWALLICVVFVPIGISVFAIALIALTGIISAG